MYVSKLKDKRGADEILNICEMLIYGIRTQGLYETLYCKIQLIFSNPKLQFYGVNLLTKSISGHAKALTIKYPGGGGGGV